MTPVRLLLFALLLLLSCGRPRELVVLLPDAATGAGGTVTITGATQAVTLTQPLAATQADAHGQVTPATLTPEAVQTHFGTALAVLPGAGETFVLEFEAGTTVLMPASQAVWNALLARLAPHPETVEVEITGHTDTVGTLEANDQLSLARAEAVWQLLAQAGIAAPFVRPVGRGEREPRIATADETAEPRNRRVVVVVR